MYIRRQIEPYIKKANKHFPVILVTGPRQSGKTTLLNHLKSPKRRFVTLDDLALRTLAQDDPKFFLQQFPPPLIIDEFQYAPDLLSYIKIEVDRLRTNGKAREASGMYWLTGSQNFLLMKNIRESLAGRVAIFNLLGFSPYELLKPEKWIVKNFFKQKLSFLKKNHLFENSTQSPTRIFASIIQGSLPEIALSGFDQTHINIFYSSYVQTYLERDVSTLDGVKNLKSFEMFFRLLAGRAGQLINFSEIAKEVGASVNTIREWTNILERSFHIFILPPYFNSFAKRLVKTPKLYFLDSGLQAYLTGWNAPETTLRGPLSGNIFENWVISNLVRSFWHRGEKETLYFWRTRTGEEIDIWSNDGSMIKTAEIKLSTIARESFFKHLKYINPSPFAFSDKMVFSMGGHFMETRKGLWNIPVTYLN